jgi:hypothetical protein
MVASFRVGSSTPESLSQTRYPKAEVLSRRYCCVLSVSESPVPRLELDVSTEKRIIKQCSLNGTRDSELIKVADTIAKDGILL